MDNPFAVPETANGESINPFRVAEEMEANPSVAPMGYNDIQSEIARFSSMLDQIIEMPPAEEPQQIAQAAPAIEPEQIRAERMAQIKMKLGGAWTDTVQQLKRRGRMNEIERDIAVAMGQNDQTKSEQLMKIRDEVLRLQEDGAKDDTSGFLGQLGNTIGYMWDNIKISQVSGLASGAVGAGIGALGGPGGAGAGFLAGYGRGVFVSGMASTALQGAGEIYSDLRKKGIDHETARRVSMAGGAVYGAIEQLTRFMPKGVTPAIIGNITRVADRNLKSASLRAAGRVLIGAGGESVEEGLQKGTYDLAYKIASDMRDGIAEDGHPLEAITSSQIFDNMVKESIAALPQSLVLAGATAPLDKSIRRVRSNAQAAQQKEAALGIKEEQAKALFSKAEERARKEGKEPDAAYDIYMASLGSIEKARNEEVAARNEAAAEQSRLEEAYAEQDMADRLNKVKEKLRTSITGGETQDQINELLNEVADTLAITTKDLKEQFFEGKEVVSSDDIKKSSLSDITEENINTNINQRAFTLLDRAGEIANQAVQSAYPGSSVDQIRNEESIVNPLRTLVKEALVKEGVNPVVAQRASFLAFPSPREATKEEMARKSFENAVKAKKEAEETSLAQAMSEGRESIQKESKRAESSRERMRKTSEELQKEVASKEEEQNIRELEYIANREPSYDSTGGRAGMLVEKGPIVKETAIPDVPNPFVATSETEAAPVKDKSTEVVLPQTAVSQEGEKAVPVESTTPTTTEVATETTTAPVATESTTATAAPVAESAEQAVTVQGQTLKVGDRIAVVATQAEKRTGQSGFVNATITELTPDNQNNKAVAKTDGGKTIRIGDHQRSPKLAPTIEVLKSLLEQLEGDGYSGLTLSEAKKKAEDAVGSPLTDDAFRAALKQTGHSIRGEGKKGKVKGEGRVEKKNIKPKTGGEVSAEQLAVEGGQTREEVIANVPAEESLDLDPMDAKDVLQALITGDTRYKNSDWMDPRAKDEVIKGFEGKKLRNIPIVITDMYGKKSINPEIREELNTIVKDGGLETFTPSVNATKKSALKNATEEDILNIISYRDKKKQLVGLLGQKEARKKGVETSIQKIQAELDQVRAKIDSAGLGAVADDTRTYSDETLQDEWYKRDGAFQPSGESTPIGRQRIGERISQAMSRLGGAFSRVKAAIAGDRQIVGTGEMRIGGVRHTIEVVEDSNLSMPDGRKARGSYQNLGNNRHRFTYNPTIADESTVTHELFGEMFAFEAAKGLSKPYLDQIQKAIGLDLRNKDDAHKFAVRMETEESRRKLADQMKNASPVAQQGFRAFINKLISLWNKLTGSNVSLLSDRDWGTFSESFANLTMFDRLGEVARVAGKEKRFAEGGESRAVQISKAEAISGVEGTRAIPKMGAQVRKEGAGEGGKTEIGSESRFQPSEEAGETASTWSDARKDPKKVVAFMAWRKVKNSKDQSYSKTELSKAYADFLSEREVKKNALSKEEQKLTSEAASVASRWNKSGAPAYIEGRGTPKRTLLGRISDSIFDAIESWTNAHGFINSVLGTQMADEYSRVKRESENAGKAVTVRLREELEKNKELLRRVHHGSMVDIDAVQGGDAVTGSGGRKVKAKFKPLELVNYAIQIMAGNKMADAGWPDFKQSIGSVVLEKSAEGNTDNILHIDEKGQKAVLDSLTADQKAVVNILLAQEEEIYRAVNREYQRKNGKELHKRDFYMTLHRDTSFKEMVGKALGKKDVELTEILKLISRSPMTFLLNVNNKGMLQNIKGGRLPIIIDNAVGNILEHAQDAEHYIKVNPLQEWVGRMINHNEDIQSALKNSRIGMRFAKYMKNVEDTMGGVINAGLGDEDKAFGEFLKRATTVRLASPTVVAKQAASVPSIIPEVGMKYLPSLFKRDNAFIKKIIGRSYKIRDRITSQRYDQFFSGSSGDALSADLLGDTSAYQKVQKVVGLSLRRGDLVAINSAIMAARDWVSDNKPGLTGEAFDKAVQEKAEDIIDRTQVATDVLDRTAIERGVSGNTFKKMLVYLYGSRGIQWNQILNAFRVAYRDNTVESNGKIVTTLLTVGLMQSAISAAIDAIRNGYRDSLKDDDDKEGFNLPALGIATASNMLGSIPIVGSDLGVPQATSLAYKLIGDNKKAFGAGKMGTQSVFDTTRRDIESFFKMAGDHALLTDRLKKAHGPNERRAIKQRLKESNKRAMKSVVRFGSEFTGMPLNQILNLVPEKD